jgi:murein DD-endopeptidase MepM/ murein hydrolase activator NlpD
MKNIAAAGLILVLSGVLSSYKAVSSTSWSYSDLLSEPKSNEFVFPVAGKKPFVGSFWGAIRDGGKRSHEGIDIFAKKGTPVLAISDGMVTAIQNGGRGGKTVWLKSLKYLWSEYYAHLDRQLVKVGQMVKKGQVIGTVGNTGNARLTPSHLHFGIYTWSGAINPLAYVKTLQDFR